MKRPIPQRNEEKPAAPRETSRDRAHREETNLENDGTGRTTGLRFSRADARRCLAGHCVVSVTVRGSVARCHGRGNAQDDTVFCGWSDEVAIVRALTRLPRVCENGWWQGGRSINTVTNMVAPGRFRFAGSGDGRT